MNIARETDIDLLRLKAQLMLRENMRLVEDNVRLRKENLRLRGLSPEMLQQELALLDAQLERDARRLQDEADKAVAAASKKADGKGDEQKPKKPRDRSGPREQPQLLVEPVEHPLDEADQVCPECGNGLARWDGKDDVTEEIDIVTRQFVIKKHIRPKYRCTCGCIEQADMPARLVPGGRYSNGFAVEVAAMKYVDQLPLERIARIFGREGLVIDSQTLWDQVDALARALQPAWHRLRDEALKAPVVGLDQSPWRVLGHAKVWQVWELSTPKIAYFDIAETKGHDDGARILGDFGDVVVCDAATTHAALARSGRFTLAHCWAHPFRAAKELVPVDPLRAERLMAFVQELYAIDERAGDDVETRRKLRVSDSRDVLRRLQEWRLEQRLLPSSPMAKLLGYLDNHWVGLSRFTENPLIPLDNNQTERGYLWIAVGRRSYFGSRSKRGTEVAALFYSLAESARRCGLDPKAYLTRALDDALAKRTIRLPHES